jgi:cyclophilin family peptidyl-prolyl cis-trans isomerase
LQWSAEPAISIDTTKQYYANFVTTAGDFRIALDGAKAPHTVNSFVFLARHGYYHCVIFHRVITDFVVQGGDPTGTGSGTPGYSFVDENLPKTGYPLYSVAMANSGANTNGSQFFIVSGPSGKALPGQYSLFGQVDQGTKVIDILNQAGNANGVPPTITHRILSVTITEK